MRKISLLIVVLLLIVASMQLWLNQDGTLQSQQFEQSIQQDDSAQQASIGGAFTLTDQTGKMVRETDFQGKTMLVFFGFTHCPDICPVGVSNLSKAMEMLGDKADQVAPIFITVDPERDTPDVMKTYLSHFDARMTGLTGTQEQIDQAVAAYKVYAAKGAVRSADAQSEAEHVHEYTVDHSGYIYLMDKKGQFVQVMPYNTEAPELARMVEAHLQQL